ncbi:MAG TPA: gliding motility-associated C-terminal domain-containing protein, partial [Flavobacteriales bacterium]|nr:gliding motility-associated C-terminal domain-containing protein [Flavobacteriales bacterium]
NYDPATMTAGVYTYTVTGTAPCTNATATVTVNETGTPDAGDDGTLTLCENSPAADLFAELGAGADAGGTWSGPSAVVGGQFDPATMSGGTYTYVVSASAPCTAASASIQVSVEVAGYAGSDAALTVCAGSTPVELLDLVGGGSGGVWSGPSGVDDGTFDPGSEPSGAYTYSITGAACATTSATVTVTIEAGPDAGADGIIALCSSSAAIDLSTVLNGTPDAGGSWIDGSGTVVSSLFDPTFSDGGIFTYIIPANANCPQDQATASVTVHIAPQAGTSGNLTVCASSPTSSLFDGLNGTLDAGGVWTAPDGSPHGTVLDPAADPSGLYTYTVVGTTPCVDASATVTVIVAPVPDAGSDGSAHLCSDNSPVALTSLLGGAPQPNGTWTSPSGNPVPSMIEPATCEVGTYTYTVAGIAPCGSDEAAVIVQISPAAMAGSDGSLTICGNNDTTAALLDVLNGAPSPLGTWIGPDGLAFNGLFTVGQDAPGTYTYSVQATAPCPVATAEAVVEVIPVPVAHIDVTGNEGCTPTEVTLSNTYEGSGSCTWILWNGEVVEDCAPVSRILEEAGTYGATLVVDAGNGCGADTVRVMDLVTVHEQPVADFYFLPEVLNTLDPSVQFNNTSTGATQFAWDIAGLATSTDVNTAHTFPRDLGAEYTVCLVAAAAEICTDTICRTVTIEDGFAVYVPNTFTPDGSGFNDGFKAVVSGIDPRYYHFDIFDRWGQPLYSTDDPTAEWNGNFSDGSEVPIGVYVWKLRAKDAHTSARIERVGHVTLLR